MRQKEGHHFASGSYKQQLEVYVVLPFTTLPFFFRNSDSDLRESVQVSGTWGGCAHMSVCPGWLRAGFFHGAQRVPVAHLHLQSDPLHRWHRQGWPFCLLFGKLFFGICVVTIACFFQQEQSMAFVSQDVVTLLWVYLLEHPGSILTVFFFRVPRIVPCFGSYELGDLPSACCSRRGWWQIVGIRRILACFTLPHSSFSAPNHSLGLVY